MFFRKSLIFYKTGVHGNQNRIIDFIHKKDDWIHNPFQCFTLSHPLEGTFVVFIFVWASTWNYVTFIDNWQSQQLMDIIRESNGSSIEDVHATPSSHRSLGAHILMYLCSLWFFSTKKVFQTCSRNHKLNECVRVPPSTQPHHNQMKDFWRNKWKNNLDSD